MKSRTTRRIDRSVALRAAGAAALALGGAALLPACNIVGPAYLLVHGPEKAPAVHALERDRPTVILIDDRAARLPRRALRQVIAEEAQARLLAAQALTDVIDARAALTAAGQDKYGQAQSIVAIGRAVKGEVVVYATVDEFTLTPDGQSLLPSATLRVKVVDAVKDERIWPSDSEGYRFTVRIRKAQGQMPETASEVGQAELELARQAGIGLAQLFFEHELLRSAQEGR